MLAGAETLVLAPHPDDAAFSIGGMILSRRFPGSVTIITLFGRSNYAYGSFGHNEVNVTATRKAEDAAWAREADTDLVWLNAPEASLRVGSNFHAIFGPADHAHEAVISAGRRMADCIRATNPRLILAPLGIGGHCDHVVTRELAKSIARELEIVLAFYEDLPYAHEACDQEINSAASNALVDPMPRVIEFLPGELDSKCNSLSRYATQVDASIVDAIRGHSLELHAKYGAERLWIAACDYPTLSAMT